MPGITLTIVVADKLSVAVLVLAFASLIIPDAVVLTGPERFQTYDLPLFARDRRYFYSETMSGLSPAILCCHTLIIDSGALAQSYCLLLLSHVEVDRAWLRKQAVSYGVEDLVEDLLTYLETGGDQRTSTLPPGKSSKNCLTNTG